MGVLIFRIGGKILATVVGEFYVVMRSDVFVVYNMVWLRRGRQVDVETKSIETHNDIKLEIHAVSYSLETSVFVMS